MTATDHKWDSAMICDPKTGEKRPVYRCMKCGHMEPPFVRKLTGQCSQYSLPFGLDPIRPKPTPQ